MTAESLAVRGSLLPPISHLETVPSTVETIPQQKPLVIVLPGASSNSKGMSAMKTAFARKFEPENIHVGSSILSFSKKDPPDPNKYKKLGSRVADALKDGRPVRFVLMSLGSGELYQLHEELQSRLGEDYLRTYYNQLRVYGISVSIPASRKEAVKYVGVDYGIKVITAEAPGLPLWPGRLRRTSAFITVPPADFEQNKEIYTRAVRTSLGRLSQITQAGNEQIDTIAYSPDPQRDYTKHFKPKKRRKIAKIDEGLKNAVQQNDIDEVDRLMRRRWLVTWRGMFDIYGGKNKIELKYKLGQRWLATRGEMLDIYGGNYAERMGDVPNEPPDIQKTPEGKRLQRKVLADTFWSLNDEGKIKVYGFFEKMAKAGVKMKLISPEGDITQRKEELELLAEGNPNVQVVVGELLTHAFPPGPQPEIIFSYFDE